MKHTLCKYDPPEPMHLLLSIRSDKERLYWRNTIKKKVHDFWHMENIQEAETKSSLVYIKVQEKSARSPHPIWLYSKSSPTASKKATVKAKLLTDTYMLQIHRARFNKYQINPTCLLCREGEENREHFLSTCTALHEKRTPYIEKLWTILSPDDTNMLDDTQKLTELILDPSKGHISQTRESYAQMYQLEAVGRDLIYTLHCQRANLLRA